MSIHKRRPVVYPERRGPSVVGYLALAVGMVVVLMAGGIALIAIAAVLFATPFAADWRRVDVDAAKALIDSADGPAVGTVTVAPNLVGRRTLFMTLPRRATEAEARHAWCAVILPTGISSDHVEVHDKRGQWRAPADCADPTSRLEYLYAYTD